MSGVAVGWLGSAPVSLPVLRVACAASVPDLLAYGCWVSGVAVRLGLAVHPVSYTHAVIYAGMISSAASV